MHTRMALDAGSGGLVRNIALRGELIGKPMFASQIAGNGQPFDRMLTVKEVAEVFSISVREVWRKVDRGELPRPVKVGRLCRWLGTEIQKVIERLKQQRDGGKGGVQ